MSIESNLESIALSLASIATSLASIDDRMKFPTDVASQMSPTTLPTFTAPEPVNQVPAQTGTQVPTFAPPAFAAPEPVPVAPTVQLPFNDTAGFTQYLIASFQKLEAKAPGTGGNIQRVIESIGCKNVNEVQPSSYAAVYAEVEKLVG
jgi:hypothetical protein